jgi:hypothetical protein
LSSTSRRQTNGRLERRASLTHAPRPLEPGRPPPPIAPSSGPRFLSRHTRLVLRGRSGTSRAHRHPRHPRLFAGLHHQTPPPTWPPPLRGPLECLFIGPGLRHPLSGTRRDDLKDRPWVTRRAITRCKLGASSFPPRATLGRRAYRGL